MKQFLNQTKCLMIFVFACFCLNTTGQVKITKIDPQITKAYQSIKNPEISLANFAQINEQVVKSKKILNSVSVAARVNDCNVIHQACANGNFESGSIDVTQWKGGFGFAASGQPNPLTFTEGIMSGPINSGSSYQTVVGVGTDPVTGIPTVPSDGGSYALRIGNYVTGAGSEFISKTIQVTAGQTIFPFKYALVFQDPGHNPADQPAFMVKAYDCNGTELTGVCDLGNGSNVAVSNASNPFFQSIGGSIAYRNWSQAQINLSAYIGQTVTIVFLNKDCSLGGHYGYTYIDNLCSICQSGCQYTLSINNSTTSTCSQGTICADYSLPTANNITGSLIIDLKIYQNGVQVGSTISSPSLTTGTSHCFNIDPTALGLNNALGGFDYTLTGRFTINGFPLSPIIVGNPPTGQTPGSNDDYTILCPCSVAAVCKNATVTLVNGVASVATSDVDGGSTSSCGFQSMSVSPSTFNCSNIGNNNVVLTVVGANGDVQTCNAVVTVLGEIPSCSVTSIPSNNTYTGGNPNVIYLGYGAQSTTLQVSAPASGAPYTYSWSPATGLSSTTSGAPEFTPTTAGTYVFTVTTTNVYGCATTCSITICVADIRVPGTGGKVYLSHFNSNSTCNTLSISTSAVPAHLAGHVGDHLGGCDLQLACLVARPVNEIRNVSPILVEGLQVKALPNPANGYFNITIQSNDRTPITIRIVDAFGRQVYKQTNISPNTSLTVGEKLITGNYFLEVSQGASMSNIKLVKVN